MYDRNTYNLKWGQSLSVKNSRSQGQVSVKCLIVTHITSQ